MHLTSVVCGVSYVLPGGTASLMKIRRCTAQLLLKHIIRTTRLKFFGHIAVAYSNPSMDHSRALMACVAPLPRDWNRRSGRLRHNWLRAVKSDLTPLNIGLASAYLRAQNHQSWSTLVGTALCIAAQAT